QLRMDAMRRDFVANASHELRTPLTVLRGYLDIMESEVGNDGALETWREPVHEMAKQVRRMDGLIEGLLKLARVESEGLQQEQTRIDMPRLFRASVDRIRAAEVDRHDYDMAVADDVALFGRGSELESIVTNLLTNAVRYTPAN